mmetsp:Transcript_5/g.10  ORF Transcript_5/g.10 Transcript_5/m.10 type:complete len:170 (+) Transcript_5:132-641(+)
MALVAAASTRQWEDNTIPFARTCASSLSTGTNDSEWINVFLRMWDGKTLCCVIDPKQASIVALVDGFEQKVLERYPSYDRSNFYFEVGGKALVKGQATEQQLTTTTTLFSNGSTVFVQYRNRGGCFMVSFTLMMTIFALILSSTCTCGASLLIVPLLLPFLFVLPLFCL